MKKIAIFFESTGGGNYGAQNATIERIKHLKALGQYDIDVYMLQQYPRLLPRLLKRVNKIDRPRLVVVDGIEGVSKCPIFEKSQSPDFHKPGLCYV